MVMVLLVEFALSAAAPYNRDMVGAIFNCPVVVCRSSVGGDLVRGHGSLQFKIGITSKIT